MYKTLIIFGLALGLNLSCAQTPNQNDANETYKENNNSNDSLSITPPEPKGGMPAFMSFVYKKLRYPRDAKNKGIFGTVHVRFIVDEQGEIPANSIKIINPLYPSLDKEAIRVISKSPRWTPGYDKNGKPVKTEMAFPITFR